MKSMRAMKSDKKKWRKPWIKVAVGDLVDVHHAPNFNKRVWDYGKVSAVNMDAGMIQIRKIFRIPSPKGDDSAFGEYASYSFADCDIAVYDGEFARSYDPFEAHE